MRHKPQVRWWRQYDPIFWEDEVWDQEQDEWEIIQYLRHGGILYGDRLGEETPQDLTDPRHIQVSRAWEDEQKHYKYKIPYPWEPEFIGPPRPPEHRVSRCIACNRSVPFDPFKENVCSKECQQALDNYRERMQTWLGMK